MRITIGLLSIVCSGFLSQAMAADPAPITQATQSGIADANKSESSTTTADKTAATVAKGQEVDKNGYTAHDHELLSRGYKIEMRHGEKYFCRREAPVGSHLEMKNCYTSETIDEREASSKELTRHIQQYDPKVNN